MEHVNLNTREIRVKRRLYTIGRRVHGLRRQNHTLWQLNGIMNVILKASVVVTAIHVIIKLFI